MLKKIAILITCHNRKTKTLACLDSIFQQKSDCSFEIYLCDDNSSDGTCDAVSRFYPSVHLIRGSGNLYWGRGMITAWKESLKNNSFDAFLWLNDDVTLNENAIDTMLTAYVTANKDCIISGEFCSSTGDFSYGAKDAKSKPILPNGQLQKVFYLNGNFVLVSKKTVDVIGILDWSYIHHNGDYEYGLRAQRSGIPVLTTPCYVGTCEPNNVIVNRRRKPNVSILKRFEILYSPLGYNPLVFFKYRRKYFGWKSALRDFISIHIINLLPDCIYNRKRK